MLDKVEPRSKPGTLDRRNWRRDTSGYPPEPCVIIGCDEPRDVLGYCNHGAAALIDRGVLRRRTRTLLVLLGDSDDPQVQAAVLDCWAALHDQPEPVTDDVIDVALASTPDLQDAPPEPASPPPIQSPIRDVENDRCRGCDVRLISDYERRRGTCPLCTRTAA